MSGGGEPLSPELALDKANKAIFAATGLGIEAMAAVSAILRAFASEIQEPLLADILTLDKRVDCEPGDSPETCGNCRGCLRAALLASQESCRLLAEALEYMLDRPMISLLKPELAGNTWLAKARDVLWAYRSSEAGKEKAGTLGEGNP